eukprot:m.279129 g.279129  ORF g.279129 m.279129 type:complete len:91 (-) comp17725_c0_seq1:530-802(-)
MCLWHQHSTTDAPLSVHTNHVPSSPPLTTELLRQLLQRLQLFWGNQVVTRHKKVEVLVARVDVCFSPYLRQILKMMVVNMGKDPKEATED